MEKQCIDICFPNKRRHMSDDLPLPNVHLRLKHMSKCLKSRLNCEIDAFCSNVESLVKMKDETVKTKCFSPEQTLQNCLYFTSAERPCDQTTDDVKNVKKCSESESSNLNFIPFDTVELCKITDSKQDCSETIFQQEAELQTLHATFMSLALKITNRANEKL